MILGMGGRKFRLERHRKNEELKRRREEEMMRRKEDMEQNEEPMSLVLSISRDVVLVAPPHLTVLLPLTAYRDGTVQSLELLCERLSASLPPTWTVACTEPLALCRLRVQLGGEKPHVDVGTSIIINTDLGWTLSVVNRQLTPSSCPLLTAFPPQLDSVSSVCTLLSLLDSVKLCTGSPEPKFLELCHHRALTLHGSAGEQ